MQFRISRTLSVILAITFVSQHPSIAEDRVVAPKVTPANALAAYVAAPDASYSWELRESRKISGCDVLRLHVNSQTWQGIPWRHVMHLIKPATLDPKRTDALLVVGGGSWKAQWPDNGPADVEPRGEVQLMAAVANQFRCVIAVISQVPFQPLMGGKHEDEIIAATFARYLQTRDTTWPLLLPMVKSAVRAMDTCTAASREHWDVEISNFTITGASKRGWTTWLTGAADERVTAIAPMVIDMLSMEAQMKHQLDAWGIYSEQIADYTDLGLQSFLATPPGRQLQRIVDPFAYRPQLKEAKLLIFGTNDRYWPLDACNLYWGQLQGDKHLLYVPNKGHDVDDYARVVGSIQALHSSQNGGQPLPKFSWKHTLADDAVRLRVTTTDEVDTVRGWVARSKTRDFRDAKWQQQPCAVKGNSWDLIVPRQADGYLACFSEVVFKSNDMPAFLSTNVAIFGAQDDTSSK